MIGAKVIAVSIWLYTAFQINVVDGLDCYSCTNAKAICQCTTIETCADDGSVCFSEYSQAKGYNLGCSNSSQCPTTPTISTGSGSIVGRSVQDGCFQCCSLDNCNRQLCQAPDPSCTDTTDFDCATIGSTTNYCYDSHRAQQFCRNYCGLCSLRDGGWSVWSTWSKCDVTCSNGTQTRARTCTNPAPTTCGVDCSGSNKEARVCSLSSCPVHGGWSTWSSWGTCSVTCDIGIQRRDRYCNNPFPSSDGDFCQGDSRDDRLCTMVACQDGGWSPWSAWTTCSRTCGDGLTSRSRSCTNPKPSARGSYCSGDPRETTMCRTRNCPAKVSAFTASYPTGITIIKFTKVITNIGNDYSSSTGRFTCEYPGLYYFAVSLTKVRSENDNINDYVSNFLSVNGDYKVRIETDPTDDHADYGSYEASGTLTIHLSKGDYVDVGHGAPSSHMYSFSQFSGFLILPDS